MPRRSIPRYCLHQSSCQAYVKLGGKRVYLGVHGSDDSHKRYAEELSKWQAEQSEAPTDLAIGDPTLLYTSHATAYHVKGGEQTGHLYVVRNALKYLNREDRDVPAKQFGPKALAAFRQRLINRGFSRKYINDLVGVVKRMFRWTAVEELVPVTVYQGLLTIGMLSRGRSGARETAPVKPVPDAYIDHVKGYVCPQVWRMIELQRCIRLDTSSWLRCWAAAIISSACLIETASGFSQTTCLPARRAVIACSCCRNGGVAM